MTWGSLQQASRKAQRQSLQSATIPAPVGGFNTVDPGLSLPLTDCFYAYNLLPAEYGLRARLGYAEWVTGLTGAADDTVRTVIPFIASDPANSKVFATTSSGIWDCTTSTAAPSIDTSFGDDTGDAGWGVSTVFSNYAGKWCLYADEVNGLYIYDEGGGWAAGVDGVAAEWSASTAVEIGTQCINDGGKVYICDTAGITASSGGPTGTGTNINDGTARWDYVAPATANAIGPSIADQNNGLTLSMADIVAVAVWKSRVWLVERNTSRAWYLGVNAVYGEATSFDFGAKMKAGGPLTNLFNWSYDGGSGIDTRLVGLSSGGDVVIYAGTDPSSAETFGLVGCWSVGAVPAGRRIAIDYGGDVLVQSSLGVVPLSKLVVGLPVEDGTGGARSQYATGKIGNLFNQLVSLYGSYLGWAIHIHPTDNALLILVPQGDSQDTEQLAMSFQTKGWGQYRDLPMLSAGVFNGQLHFGTSDGRLCINQGYVDNVQLADPDAWSGIQWSLLTAYSNMGNARQKQVKMVRPNMMSDGPQPQAVPTVRYGLDTTEPDPPVYTPPTFGGNLWNGGVWDLATWGSVVSVQGYSPIYGGAGMGREAAIALRGTAVARTILVSIDVFFEQGGLM